MAEAAVRSAIGERLVMVGFYRSCPAGRTAPSFAVRRICLPEPVAKIYEAVEELTALYPGRPFTPDGHLVGSIGEVIAAQTLGLKLYPPSQPGHDADDDNGDVQIKLTAGNGISMYATCDRLVVLKIISPREAEIAYDGPGAVAWDNAGKMAKNGQLRISLARLQRLDKEATC